MALFLLMTWFIADQLFLKNDIKTQYRFFVEHLQLDKSYLLIGAILLMPVNWGLETIKWRTLMQSRVPFFELLKSVIAGITVGFVTPGRGGEFVGRAMFLSDGNKAKIFFLSSIGGLAQTAASLVIGVPFVYLWRNDPLILGIVTGGGFIYLLLFFRFDLLNQLIMRVPFLQRYGIYIDHKDLPEIGVQLNVLTLSFIRFLVYSFQYVLLMMFFGVSSSWLGLLTNTIVFLLAQTFSPLVPLLDVSVRGGIALFVFGTFTENNIAVLTTVMCVWLLNLVIPTLIGYLFILKKR